MQDDNFIEQLKKENPKALDYVFDKYGNLIFKVAYTILNNRELSEECVNDVLMKIWKNIKTFNKGNEKFKAWIIVITKYTAIDLLRKEKKHGNTVPFEAQEEKSTYLESNLENKEIKDKLLSAIKALIKKMKIYSLKDFFLITL